MPTSGRSRPSAAEQPTRQQLDELDDLMQRMLSLPVDPQEETPNSNTSRHGDATWESSSASARTEATIEETAPLPEAPQDENSEVDQSAMRIPGQAEWGAELVITPPLLACEPIFAPWEQRTDDEDMQPSSEPPAGDPEQSFGFPAGSDDCEEPHFPSFDPLTSQHKVVVSGGLRPLVWSNQRFDRCAAWMGPGGRWLAGSSGRTFLAWIGSLLLLAALTWAALDAFDWTW